MSRKLLSLHRHPPGLLAREALDAVLVAGVFDQQVTLLFREDGVGQLLAPGSNDELAESIRSLPDYGITGIYVCQDSLESRGIALTDLLVSAQAISAEEQGRLLAAQDMVLSD